MIVSHWTTRTGNSTHQQGKQPLPRYPPEKRQRYPTKTSNPPKILTCESMSPGIFGLVSSHLAQGAMR